MRLPQVLGILAFVVAVAGFQLDIHSCTPVENREFAIVGLKCEIIRQGLYTFNGERPHLKNIQTIDVDRITEHSIIQIRKTGNLKTIRVATGDCTNVLAPKTIEVYVVGGICDPITTPMTAAVKETGEILDETTLEKKKLLVTTQVLGWATKAEGEVMETTKDVRGTTKAEGDNTETTKAVRGTTKATGGTTKATEGTTEQDKTFTPHQHTTGLDTDMEHTYMWIYPTVTAIIDSFIYITVSLLTLVYALIRRYPELQRFIPFPQPVNLNQLAAQPMAPALPIQPIPAPGQHQEQFPLRRSTRIRNPPKRLNL